MIFLYLEAFAAIDHVELVLIPHLSIMPNINSSKRNRSIQTVRKSQVSAGYQRVGGGLGSSDQTKAEDLREIRNFMQKLAAFESRSRLVR